ncbi:hypothetical protein DNU06_11120 [Putridiphycobacter roseus]|uniref:Secretion system C-terminal sorting domain-containing protein n=1 Tax=Putridiphycobacter roseus TaxID=2219161 RepID=A0A2W1MZV1_9FLAO|nr:hypothetical protein [Putridiphycobacter roseus]PZE16800.1 hypothetical protein DNU06_11120 [Putridiphycobacter roseus]
MGDSAGLNDASTYDIIMGMVYGITAALLIVTAYIIYTKQFRRKKLEALNTIKFETAKYNIYSQPTQLLIEVPLTMEVELDLLDGEENLVNNLFKESIEVGEKIINFDPNAFKEGSYFFKLTAPGTSILKKIIISHQK